MGVGAETMPACLRAETSQSPAERTVKVFTWNTEWAAPTVAGLALGHPAPPTRQRRRGAHRDPCGCHPGVGRTPRRGCARTGATDPPTPRAARSPCGPPAHGETSTLKALPRYRPGGYVAATTDTRIGPLRTRSVYPLGGRPCQHRQTRRQCEEHLAYLAALTQVQERELSANPLVVVAGDFKASRADQQS